MELIDIDAIQTQAFQAAFQGLCEMIAAGIMSPLSGTGTLPSSFGGDDQVGWVWIQRFRNQFLRDRRPIGIGSVDQVHVEVNRAPQGCECGSFINGRSPNAWTRNAHGSKSQAI